MNEAEFLEELNKYPKVREADYQGPTCSPFNNDESLKSILFAYYNLIDNTKEIRSSKISARHQKIIKQASLFRTLNESLKEYDIKPEDASSIISNFIKQYEMLLKKVDLESCEQLLFD